MPYGVTNFTCVQKPTVNAVDLYAYDNSLSKITITT